MSPRARAGSVALGITLLAATLVGVVVVRRTYTVASGSDRGAPMWRLRWEASHAYIYDLAAHTKQRVTLGDAANTQAIDGELTIDGELVLRVRSVASGHAQIGVSLRNLETASLVVSGAEGLRDTSEVADKEALVEVDELGRVDRVLLKKDDSTTAKYVMQAVVSMLQVTLPEAPSREWTADEPTLLGSAHATYRGVDGRAMDRSHTGYLTMLAAPDASLAQRARVQSDDRIALDQAGAPESWRTNEHVVVPGANGPRVVADVWLDVKRKRVESFVPEAIEVASYEAHRPNEVIGKEEMHRAMLEQLAAGLTIDGLEMGVAAYAGTGTLPRGFLTSCAALVTLHPEYAGAIEAMFERPESPGATRALLLDVLASAGTPAAQAALRDAVGSDAARTDAKMFPAYVTRVGLVVGPEKATMDLAFSLYAAKDRAAHGASAYALGSTLASVARSGDRADVAKYNDRLRADLERARRADDRVAVLGALGNAGLPENVKAVRAYARDESVNVRHEAALALRKTDVPEAHAALMDLLGDSDEAVAVAALGSIGTQHIDADRLSELTTFVQTHGAGAELNEALLTVAGAHTDLGEADIALLRAVLTRSHDGHTLARARMILSQLGVDG